MYTHMYDFITQYVSSAGLSTCQLGRSRWSHRALDARRLYTRILAYAIIASYISLGVGYIPRILAWSLPYEP